MITRRLYRTPSVNRAELVETLKAWLGSHGLEVQVLDAPGEGVHILAQRHEPWRPVLGVSSALSVFLRPEDDRLIVEVGIGKKVEGRVTGPGGLFLLWALFFTAAYSLWLRSKVPEHTFGVVERFIATGAPPKKQA